MFVRFCNRNTQKKKEKIEYKVTESVSKFYGRQYALTYTQRY